MDLLLGIVSSRWTEADKPTNLGTVSFAAPSAEFAFESLFVGSDEAKRIPLSRITRNQDAIASVSITWEFTDGGW